MMFSSCFYATPKWVESNSQNRQPRLEEFKFSKKAFRYNSIIDTSIIYLCQDKFIFNNGIDEKKFFSYIRFSSNGTAYLSTWFERKPNPTVLGEMVEGQFCLYKIESNNIALELYNHSLGYFEFWHGKIDENGDLFFYQYKGRPWTTAKGQLQLFYKKEEIKVKNNLVFPK